MTRSRSPAARLEREVSDHVSHHGNDPIGLARCELGRCHDRGSLVTALGACERRGARRYPTCSGSPKKTALISRRRPRV